MTDSAVRKSKSNGTGEVQIIRCAFCRRYLGRLVGDKDCEVYIHCPQCKNHTAILGDKQYRTLTDEDLCAKVNS